MEINVFMLLLYLVLITQGSFTFHRSCFVLFDSLRPINNLSDIKGRVFLG